MYVLLRVNVTTPASLPLQKSYDTVLASITKSVQFDIAHFHTYAGSRCMITLLLNSVDMQIRVQMYHQTTRVGFKSLP